MRGTTRGKVTSATVQFLLNRGWRQHGDEWMDPKTAALYVPRDARAIQLWRDAPPHIVTHGGHQPHAYEQCEECSLDVRDYRHCRQCGTPDVMHAACEPELPR